MLTHVLRTLLCFTLLFCLSAPAYAVSKKDLQILGRAIGFIKNGPDGHITIAIVHNPSDNLSNAEADQLIEIIGSGIKSGTITLTATKVTADEAPSHENAIIYFAQGTEAMHQSVYNAAAAKGIITVSTHDSCLNTNQCVIVIKSNPRVDIKVSTAAAEETDISFGSAFRMMISEQ